MAVQERIAAFENTSAQIIDTTNNIPAELTSSQKSKVSKCFSNIRYVFSLPIILPYKGVTYALSKIVTAAKTTGSGITIAANAIWDKKFYILYGGLAIACGIIPHYVFPNSNPEINNQQALNLPNKITFEKLESLYNMTMTEEYEEDEVFPDEMPIETSREQITIEDITEEDNPVLIDEDTIEELPMEISEEEIVNQEPIQEKAPPSSNKIQEKPPIIVEPQIAATKEKYTCHPCNLIKSEKFEKALVTTVNWVKQGLGWIKDLFS